MNPSLTALIQEWRERSKKSIKAAVGVPDRRHRRANKVTQNSAPLCWCGCGLPIVPTQLSNIPRIQAPAVQTVSPEEKTL